LRRFRADRVEQLGTGDEHHASASEEQQPAAHSRISVEVGNAAFDRAQGDRVNHQERLEPRFNREQSGQLRAHTKY
jgi:hypothetical protein